MIRLKPIGIILAMLLSIYLIGIVNNSEAASITYLNVYANTDYGGGSHFNASLFADENINYIDWYVKKTYPKREDGKENDYEHVHTSMHGGTSSVSVSFGTFDGDIKIAEYDVKAVVAFEEDSDTNTTKTYVYKPVFEGGYKKLVPMATQNLPLTTMMVHILSWTGLPGYITGPKIMCQDQEGSDIQLSINHLMS